MPPRRPPDASAHPGRIGRWVPYRSLGEAGYPIVAAMEVERMRERHSPQITMLAFIDLEERVPMGQPLRFVGELVACHA